MKLAEALTYRADVQRKIAQLKERIMRNAKVQEGETPAEEPSDLIVEVEGKIAELETLVVRINRTNSKTPFDDNSTIADALAKRDALAQKRDLYFDLAKAATVTQDRYKALEIKFRGAVSVRETQKKADSIAKEFRELDLKIQQMNWTIDLVD